MTGRREQEKTGQPENNPTFVESPTFFIVSAGTFSMNVGPANTADIPAHLLWLDGPSVDAFIENGKLKFNVMLLGGGGAGDSPVEISGNVFKVVQPNWDRNFDDTALEIVDQRQEVRLQVIYNTPHNVSIYGLLSASTGTVYVATPQASDMVTPKSQTTWEQTETEIRTVRGFPLKRIFKYPSRYNQGQREGTPSSQESAKPLKQLVSCEPNASISVCNADGTKLHDNYILNGSMKVDNSDNAEISGTHIKNMVGKIHDVYKRGMNLSDDCKRRQSRIAYQNVRSDEDLKNQIVDWKNSIPSLLLGDDIKIWSDKFGAAADLGDNSLDVYCSQVDYYGERMNALRALAP